MEENKNTKKKDASMFFGVNKVAATPGEGFKLNLQQELFQNYINFYSNSVEKKNNGFFRRLKFIIPTLLVVVLAVGGGFLVFSQNNKESKVNKLGAEVAFYEGDLEFMNEDGGWSDVIANTAVNENSSLRMSGEGLAVINIDDGSSVRINSNSSFSFKSLDANRIVIANDAGEIYTRVVKSDRQFIVETPEATYESLGTAYKTINKNDVQGVEVYHSKVKVNTNDKKEIIVNEGSKVYVKNETAKIGEVQNIDATKLAQDKFVQWNKEQDKKDFSNELGILKDKVVEETKESVNTETKPVETQPNTVAQPAPKPAPAPAPAPAPTGTITISNVVPMSSAFKVFWSTANLNASQGYKVVYATSPNPTFGINSAQYESNPGATFSSVGGLTSGTYYVRVCMYTGSGCTNYSNQVSVSVTAPAPISSVSLSAGSGTSVNWSVVGEQAEGFKLVYSKNPSPAYPTGVLTFANFYDKNQRTGNISANDGSGTYYVRTCVYNGGACGVYSNEITMVLP